MLNRRLVFIAASAALYAAAPLVTAHAQEPPVPVVPPTTPATTPPAATTAPPAPAPDDATPKPPKKRFTIGPEVGAYIPTSNKARDAFGDTWYNYGFGFGAIQSADLKGRFQFDLNILGGSRSGNRAYLFPLGASYRRALTTNRSASPYVGASLNFVPTYLRAGNYGVTSKLRYAGGASAFAGFTFSDSAYLQARYYAISKSAGFDLSGLSLSAGFRF